MEEIVHGSCDGTGAAINVCLGFVPRYVKVWNVEHANEKSLEWHKGMALFTNMDEGVSLDNSTVAPVTANGITEYEGGDEIIYDAETNARWEDSAGDSVEEKYVNGAYEVPAAGTPLYQCIGDVVVPQLVHGAKVKTPKGFTIGTNGINADNEQLAWMAFR